MRLLRTLQKNTLAVFAADAGARALQVAGLLRFAIIFLQGIILVKAGVPLMLIGQIEFVLFVANFFLFFWLNGGQNAMLSWASGDQRDSAAGVVFAAMHLFALIAAALLWLIILVPGVGQYALLTTSTNLIYLTVYVFFTIPAVVIIYRYLLGQSRDTAGRILAYTGVTGVLQVAAVLIPALMGHGVETILQYLAIFAFVRWAFVLITGRWFAHGLPSRARIGAYMLFALPLVIHAFNSGLMDYVDGWIVSWFYGDELFAIYRYGARELPLNALLIGGLTMGLLHRFKASDQVDTAVLRSEILRSMRMLFPVNGALILLSPVLYTLVYREEFVLSARIFNIYALTLMSRVIINQLYLYVYRHNWVLTWSTLVEVAINIVLSILFIRWIGLLGIPLATVVAYALHKAFLVMYIRAQWRARITDYVPLRSCIWYFAGLAGSFILAEIIWF